MGHTFVQYLRYRVLVGLLRIIARVRFFFGRGVPALHPGVTLRRLRVPSRNPGRTIAVDLYEPEEVKKPTPVLINLHGSGFVIPSLGQDREWCSLVASRAHIPVLDSDYRKAPEWPFPSATEDFQDVLAWVRDQAHLYDQTRILLSGFSAGGNLIFGGSVEDARTLKERFPSPLVPPPRIRAVLGIYPSVDLAQLHVAPDVFVPKSGHAGVAISVGLRNMFYGAYLSDTDRKDIRVSSAYASLDLFPHFVYIACGSADSLYSPNKALLNRLDGTESPAADGEGAQPEKRVVRFVGLEGEEHGYDKLALPGSIAEQHKIESYEAAVEMIIQAIA